MDIYCGICAEPVDIDYLHDVAKERGSTFLDVLHDFQANGCPAVGFTCSEPDPDRAPLAAVLYDLLGDDIDGAANMFEDMGW